MLLILVLIIVEILSVAVIRQHFYSKSKYPFYVFVILHIILSLWFWILFISVTTFRGAFDMPYNVWNIMQLSGMFAAVIMPRVLLVIMHFTGKLVRRKTGGHINWLTNTGFIIYLIVIIVIGSGTLLGRFNTKTENIEIKIRGLKDDLDGFRIVQLSDLHLAGFYHHREFLEKQMRNVTELNPDLLLNTGDFVTFGWREFDGFDTILNKAHGRYGTYAVMGNHDFGTYQKYFTEADRENNVLRINQLIEKSGYKILNDEHEVITIKGTRIGLAGVTTKGRYPDIIHGDLDKALMDLDSVDFQILLSHDPNHWELAVEGKTDINLTLSGHTHGMQMGIYTRRFRWSPSKYFYPRWSGLYNFNDQYLYVNRGLGVLAIPFRIWMPPEITLITLRKE